MAEKNWIQKTTDTYKLFVPSPLVQAGLLGTLGVGGMLLFRKPVNRLLKTVISKVPGVDPRDVLQGFDEMLNDPKWKWVLPVTLGLTPAVLATATQFDPQKRYYGLTKWSSLKKRASLWDSQGYQPQTDFAMPVNVNLISDVFRHNPIIANSPYASNLGTSIVKAADNMNGRTTLGSIFDSAVNKFLSKLTLGGIINTGVKSLVSGSLAGMFTDAVGTFAGMPQPLRGLLSTSVGLGTALYNILT